MLSIVNALIIVKLGVDKYKYSTYLCKIWCYKSWISSFS